MSVLALQKQSKFIKKTIQLPNGSWALVVFELVEINGKITAKAVCGKILGQENSVACEEILALPVYFETETIEPVASPFFADVINLVKDLSFVISQPSRAPNFC
ncbi:MAG: hypothetical protein WC933_02300 [Candidatus Paceibacterota bacterium]|jgi:hypothetical protein